MPPLDAESLARQLLQPRFRAASQVKRQRRTRDEVTTVNIERIDEYVTLLADQTMAEPFILHECPIKYEAVDIRCNINPYKNTVVRISGGSKFAYYANKVLNPVYAYLEKSQMRYDGREFVCVHGGVHISDEEKSISDRVLGDHTTLEKVSYDVDRNDLHQLGFGGSIITGRLFQNLEAIAGKADIYMDSSKRFTIVGHTPQNLGLPTVIRHSETPSKFLILLDTQMSNREKNASCIAWNDELFLVRGYFEHDSETYNYESSSTDDIIGTVREHEKTPFRIVALVKNGTLQGKYVGVKYNGRELNFTSELQFFDFAHPTEESEGGNNDATTPTFTHVACGDIEGSMPFLKNFLTLACSLLQVETSKIPSIPNKKGMIADELRGMTNEIQSKATIVCIGDVIGFAGPFGIPSEKRDKEFVPTTDDEGECLLWANTERIVKIIGNRDINKLRFLDELMFLNVNPQNVDIALNPILAQSMALMGNCFPYVKDQGFRYSKHPNKPRFNTIWDFQIMWPIARTMGEGEKEDDIKIDVSYSPYHSINIWSILVNEKMLFERYGDEPITHDMVERNVIRKYPEYDTTRKDDIIRSIMESYTAALERERVAPPPSSSSVFDQPYAILD
jgi:hypothetical protein